MSATRPITLRDGFVFPEAPRWHEGRLWFSDIQAHRLMTLSPDGVAEIIADFDDEPSGLGFLPDGAPVVALRRQRILVRLDGDGHGTHADLSEYTGPAVGSGPPPHDYMLNDMVVSESGHCFVDLYYRRDHDDAGLPLGEALLCVGPDGSHRIAADALLGPNGIAITSDGATLIVAEMAARRLTAFTLSNQGVLSNRRVFADLGEHRPDGICLDAEGAVWVAAPGSKQVLRVREGGGVADSIAMESAPVACMLGGDDRRTLFIATADFTLERLSESKGAIAQCRVEVEAAGRP